MSDQPRTAAATQAAQLAHAHRAVDDPVKLAKAARIVRVALARRKLTVADLSPSAPTDGGGGSA